MLKERANPIRKNVRVMECLQHKALGNRFEPEEEMTLGKVGSNMNRERELG